MKYKLIMNGLDCAGCAAKIEKAIAGTEGFEEVSLVFPTKSLYFEHVQDNGIIEKVQKITDSIEDGVVVSESEHKHHHGHSCEDGCCGHEHSHGHEHEHSHEHEHEKTGLSTILLFAAIGFAAAALVLDIFKVSEIAVAILSAVAIVLSGYKVCVSGVKSVLKLHIDETTLMTVAVIAAFCLGQFVEGAMVTILFGIGELLEDKAVENSRRSIEKLANIQADEAVVIENGKEKTVSAESVAVGTEIVIKPFAKIPVDCVITEGKTTVDASALTGESMPAAAEPGTELMSGMVNGERLVKARTTKLHEDSAASRIIRLVEEASVTKSKNEKLITRFAAVYTPVVILISLAIAFIPPIFFGNLTDWIYRGLVCLVASCPCAIVISVPLSYYSGIGAASKYGVLFKGGRFLEALAKADGMVFDKTGTLTEGKLKVEKIFPYKNYTEKEILAMAAGCERNSTHPIARAISSAYDGKLPEMSDFSEKPGYGVSAVYNGQELTCGNKKLAGGKEIDGSVAVVYGGELIGSIKVADTVRAEAQGVVERLKAFGFKKLVMLTGDSADIAKEVSGGLGLTGYRGDLLPEDKVNAVNELKKQCRSVAFAGDGINDSPVIAAADCGFAMGLGSEAAIASADAVLTSGNLSALPAAVKIARKTVATAKANIIFALAVKAAVIILAFFGLAAIWMSVIADTGVCMLCVLYATRLLKVKVGGDH